MAEYNCINCKYGNTTDDYEHCGNCDKGSEFVKMTNADRITSMSDEELVEVVECPYRICIHRTDDIGCDKCTLEWLKSEVKE